MKKLFAILIMCLLSLPVPAIEEQAAEFAPAANNTVENVLPSDADDINNIQMRQDVTAAEEQLPSKFKEPTSKKNIVFKFIIAMLCVAGASVFLYVALSVYNKIRDNVSIGTTVTPPEGEKPLDSPNDLTEAIKTFVEKTKWDN